ncbi:MAG: large conductance mechanosensitive channel protein MscL [Oscillospiraceae bacterium]|nr:large conductance mechanosensitive channel protein MscL [Oscillospiraceae bacterium]
MLKEFKDFALKGNVVDMAVGVVIGGAFGKIVTSLVNDIIMPVITIFTGNIDYTNLFVSLDGQKYATLADAQAAGAATLNYGSFINNIINFLIIAISIFIVIRQMSKIQKGITKKKGKEVPPPAPTTKECPFCKSTIHIDAVKCPNCTSDQPLPPAEPENTPAI